MASCKIFTSRKTPAADLFESEKTAAWRDGFLALPEFRELAKLTMLESDARRS